MSNHRKVGDMPFKNMIRMVMSQCGKQRVTGLIHDLNLDYYKILLWYLSAVFSFSSANSKTMLRQKL